MDMVGECFRRASFVACTWLVVSVEVWVTFVGAAASGETQHPHRVRRWSLK